jgi:nicotinate-nucleotide adenylyltransferase
LTASLPRVGLYGGAFDPPHNAHVALAQAFTQQAQLDKLHICPTAGAWHKARALSDASSRLRMCELAFAALPQAVVDDQEMRRAGKTYTVDTLEALHAMYPGSELALLIGQDQWEMLHTWHAVPRIEQLATVYVAPRSAAGLAQQPHNLHPGHRLLSWTVRNDSATVVRERRRAGQPIDDLVTPAVARYIAEHHLYL